MAPSEDKSRTTGAAFDRLPASDPGGTVAASRRAEAEAALAAIEASVLAGRGTRPRADHHAAFARAVARLFGNG